MFTVADAWGVVQTAGGCSHHQDVTFNEADIKTCFWYNYGCNHGDYADQRAAEAKEAAKRAAANTGAGGLDDNDEFHGRDGKMCNSYCDSFSEAFFILNDGRYVTASEWSDTSGHGCQCSGSIEFFATKEEFIKLGIDANKLAQIERYIE